MEPSRDLTHHHINILKGLAIIAVIIIHTLSNFSRQQSPGPFQWLFLILDQTSRFSVPLFISLSGFGLTKKFAGQKLFLPSYLTYRLRKLVPPYLLWALISLMALGAWSHFSSRFLSPQLAISLALGQIDYHLYFVPLILQFYFLFPLLHYLVSKTDPGLLIALAFGLQVGFFEASGLLGLSYHSQYVTFVGWVGYFILGMVLARYNLHRLLRPKILALILLTGGLSAVWSILTAHQIITSGANIIDATRFTRLPLVIYTTAFITASALLAGQVHRLSRRSTVFLAAIGRHSYTIFLSHTLILRLFFDLARHQADLRKALLLSLVYTLALALTPKFQA